MQEIFKHIHDKKNDNEILSIKISDLEDLIYPKFVKVKDCIVISEKDAAELEYYFERVLPRYTDKTGYETSHNTIQLKYVFENDISSEIGVKIALLLMEVWTPRIKSIDEKAKIVFIISNSEDSGVDLRFHKLHDGEGLWISQDIEGYEEAVAYTIV